jgi:hypothetical protein
LPSSSPSNGEYYPSTAATKKKKRKITTIVIMVSPQKKGNRGDKGTSKTPPITPTGRQPEELRYVKTTTAITKKEGLLEQPMTFYPFTKDTTITPPLIMMMKQLLEEAPLFL